MNRPITIWIAGLVWAFASGAVAQQPELPPGHPPANEPAPAPQLPPGHPPSAQAPQLPPGHPTPNAQPAQQPGMPPGHPPAQGAPQGQMPPGHPSTGATPGQAPPQHGDMQGALRPPQLTSAQPNRELPAGAIRVTVVDAAGQPVANAAVDVGSLAQGERERFNGRTDSGGQHMFEGLSTGPGQAYRVNVPHEGATYSSDPFRLPADHGYDVRVTRLPVTHDDRLVFFRLFRVIIELRDQRIHVVTQAELTNAGRETYVFPQSGRRVQLPEDFLVFQFQRVISDQRVEEISDEGYAIRGSLPPGSVRLVWGYDLPMSGSTFELPVEIPLRAFQIQVISEAPEEMTMAVPGMDRPREHDLEGQTVWVTEEQLSPGDAPIDHLTIRLSGIPSPLARTVGLVAVPIALLFIFAGALFLFVRAPSKRTRVREQILTRRKELLREARELEADFADGEVGPKYRQKKRAEIVRELAILLHEESELKGASA